MIKTLVFSSSAEVELPTSWENCSQEQLLYLYLLFTQHRETAEIKVLFALRNAGMEMIAKISDTKYKVFLGEEMAIVSAAQVTFMVDKLQWLDEPSQVPIRLEKIGNSVAIDAYLHDLPFGKYLTLDNLYQGYLQSQDDDDVQQMAAILYPGYKVKKRIQPVHAYAVFNWYLTIKRFFAQKWRDLFEPSGEGGAVDQEASMNAQIRALTGGDVLKETAIWNDVDTWRALTELNEKAKEYKQLKKKS